MPKTSRKTAKASASWKTAPSPPANPSWDEEKDDGPRRCPYCKSTDVCPHLLLFIDAGFGSGYGASALGGPLAEGFNTAWESFVSKHADDPGFPHDPFRDLLLEVTELADASRDYGDESPPGCCNYRAFYLESPHDAKAAIQAFRSACGEWRTRWPDGGAPDQARAPRRRSTPSARRGSARKPAVRRR
jgi:hypothetical protein